jgi:hypothetical protein
MCGAVRPACSSRRRAAWLSARQIQPTAVRTAAHGSFAPSGRTLAPSARSGRPGPPASDWTGTNATLDHPHHRHRGPARPDRRRDQPRRYPGTAAPPHTPPLAASPQASRSPHARQTRYQVITVRYHVQAGSVDRPATRPQRIPGTEGGGPFGRPEPLARADPQTCRSAPIAVPAPQSIPGRLGGEPRSAATAVPVLDAGIRGALSVRSARDGW